MQILILTILLISGCIGSQAIQTQTQPESWKLAAYNTLIESKMAYDKAFTALGLADQAGKLSSMDKSKAIKYGRLYRDAHNAAVLMLLNNQQPDLVALRQALVLFETLAIPHLKRSISWTPSLLPCLPSWA